MTTELFEVVEAPVEEVNGSRRREPLVDRIEQHFRDHRYESFTGQELIEAFPGDRIDSVRATIRRLLKEKTIKSTGMVRFSTRAPQPQPIPDVVCLTLILGK